MWSPWVRKAANRMQVGVCCHCFPQFAVAPRTKCVSGPKFGTRFDADNAIHALVGVCVRTKNGYDVVS